MNTHSLSAGRTVNMMWCGSASENGVNQLNTGGKMTHGGIIALQCRNLSFSSSIVVSLLVRLCAYLDLDDVVKVGGESSGQPENVGVLSLSVPQALDLRLQFGVHSPRSLAQFLVDGLAGHLVRRDRPVLD